MYRQIFTPNENNSRISFVVPPEWYGQAVEIIVSPLNMSTETRQLTDDEFCGLAGEWDSELTADEMIAEMKASRRFKERRISF